MLQKWLVREVETRVLQVREPKVGSWLRLYIAGRTRLKQRGGSCAHLRGEDGGLGLLKCLSQCLYSFVSIREPLVLFSQVYKGTEHTCGLDLLARKASLTCIAFLTASSALSGILSQAAGRQPLQLWKPEVNQLVWQVFHESGGVYPPKELFLPLAIMQSHPGSLAISPKKHCLQGRRPS